MTVPWQEAHVYFALVDVVIKFRDSIIFKFYLFILIFR